MRICFKKETPDIPPTTINDIQIEQVHSTTRCHHFTRSYVATPYQRHHNKSFTTTKLHYSIQAFWNRTASSRQNMYHNHPFCHRIRLPSMAYQSDNKTNKAFRKGPCALYFVECVITTPLLQREYQPWQTGERRCADPCSRRCSKPTTSCTISCRPPGHVTTLFVTLANRFKNSFVPYGLYH